MQKFEELIDSVSLAKRKFYADGQYKESNCLSHSIWILSAIKDFIDKHGNIALQCGSEWLYQDDKAKVDALNLVGDILDNLYDYAEER